MLYQTWWQQPNEICKQKVRVTDRYMCDKHPEKETEYTNTTFWGAGFL